MFVCTQLPILEQAPHQRSYDLQSSHKHPPLLGQDSRTFIAEIQGKQSKVQAYSREAARLARVSPKALPLKETREVSNNMLIFGDA